MVAEDISLGQTKLALFAADYERVILKALENKFEMFVVYFLVRTVNEEDQVGS